MDKPTFLKIIRERLETNYGSSKYGYDEKKVGMLVRDVLKKLSPNRGELLDAIEHIKKTPREFLPNPDEIARAVIHVRWRNKSTPEPSPCYRCHSEAPGYLWLRRDHPSGQMGVAGCGCPNTPPGVPLASEWIMKGYFVWGDWVDVKNEPIQEKAMRRE